MAGGPSQERAASGAEGEVDATRSPDELEQQQRADGTLESPGVVDDDLPDHPDVLEQRMAVDGGVDGPYDDPVEEPHPDVIEQRMVVELDEDEWRE